MKNRFACCVSLVKTLNKLREGGFISSRGYREAKNSQPSARELRDQQLVALIGQIHASNYSVYGVRKIWHALKRRGIEVGGEQTLKAYASSWREWQKQRTKASNNS
ncbi:IS3 family transposase [Arcanobacterium pinnipediorum]|uniref:IS3 family transposase n=1 Tax=Arcanobacterium pinnipediorum TaxID=1503041 RepID=A0ABY5AKQ0_9ACTO|nr:IS3 family transposase [Arcanobacterium pinnipediorum]USR79996.1 IS3 family transposase [Arcanobacterium pinnipediorum]